MNVSDDSNASRDEDQNLNSNLARQSFSSAKLMFKRETKSSVIIDTPQASDVIIDDTADDVLHSQALSCCKKQDENGTTRYTVDESEELTSTFCDYEIEAKTSCDLSINEDKILGFAAGDETPVVRESNVGADHVNDLESNQLETEMPYYDDDSYINQNDTESRGLDSSESFKTSNEQQPCTSSSCDSENMSLYVEDEFNATKEDSVPIEKFQDIKVSVDNKESEINDDNNLTPVRKNLHRINPSPKDNDEYRMKYFGEASSLTKSKDHRKNTHGNINQKNGSAACSIIPKKSLNFLDFDAWGSISKSGFVDSIEFNEIDRLIDNEPAIVESVSNSKNTAFCFSNELTSTNKLNSSLKSKRQMDAIAFDPFCTDIDRRQESSTIKGEYFSSCDSFTEDHSFSRSAWPFREDDDKSHHVEYSSAPGHDSRVEI